MRRLLYVISLSSGLALLSGNFQAKAQSPVNSQSVATGDSLSLAQVMQTVIKGHPTIKEAEEVISEADAKIGLAKSAYLPNVNANVSYTRLWPDPTIQGFGQLFPENSFSAGINYEQTLYDFGKTKKSVGLENENKVLAGMNADLAKQKLSLFTANTFYMLVFLQEAIKIKDRELQVLKEHLDFVEKKRATGSATQYELLSIKVKISTTENQKLDLETTQKIQQTVLKLLMGLPVTTVPMVKQELSQSVLVLSQDSLLTYAFSHRVEMNISKERETITGLQYNLIKSQNNPVLNIFASGGEKNGYFPKVDDVKLNYVAGAGLKIPLFDGNRKKYNLLQSKSSMNNATFDSELVRRNITNEVVESEANRVSFAQKIEMQELQVAQAEEAFALAKVNFAAGSITNLDLLDAENIVSESRLMLLKSKVDYTASMFKLNVSLGNKMY